MSIGRNWLNKIWYNYIMDTMYRLNKKSSLF